MGARERRLIRKFMVFASVLVALMVAVTLWIALQEGGRPTPAGPAQPGASSGASGP